MIYSINETHDLSLRSWVESANAPDTDFPIQNLPLGVFRRKAEGEPPRVGIAIGDQALDVAGTAREGLFDGAARPAASACMSVDLNGLMGMGHVSWSALRARVSRMLGAAAPAEERERTRPHLIPQAEIEMLLPARVGDYSDFYASIHHATNVGRMMRPDNPLLPNYKYIPIGYQGRSSSIVVSGTPVRRPRGQRRPDPSQEPEFDLSKNLDYELEVGFFVGPGNPLGTPIHIDDAEANLFGVCLLNDWSARDLQSWEYQPLGPFLSKNFATTISPWIVTLEALEPFRAPLAPRGAGDPTPLPYLSSQVEAGRGALDVLLEVGLASRKMRELGMAPVQICRSRLRDLYWTPGQMITHHASNGCNLRPGDLLGSGTVSGPVPEARGCLLERTVRGTEPFALPSGEPRRFLEDGDEVILSGFCERAGFARIGLGECRGLVVSEA